MCEFEGYCFVIVVKTKQEFDDDDNDDEEGDLGIVAKKVLERERRGKSEAEHAGCLQLQGPSRERASWAPRTSSGARIQCNQDNNFYSILKEQQRRVGATRLCHRIRFQADDT